MAKKAKPKRLDIRLNDVPEKLFNKIVASAEQNIRTQKDEIIYQLTKIYKA